MTYHLADHQKACSEYGVWPVADMYYQGREAGLKEYCNLYHAVEEGLDGRRYKGVCPAKINSAYRRLNDAACKVHDLRNDIRNKNNQLESLDHERLKDSTLGDRRKEIRLKIQVLERELDQLRYELNWQEYDLDRLTSEILYQYSSE